MTTTSQLPLKPLNKPAIEQLAERVDELRAEARKKNTPELLAVNSGATCLIKKGTAEIQLSLFGRQVRIPFPELMAGDMQTGDPLPVSTQALLLYYLNTADGTPLEGRWVAFASLPGGRFYAQAFQGYSGDELAGHFGNNLEKFEQAARKLDGMSITYGDVGFVFYALPRVMLAVVAYRGDEDFPPSYRILFDASAGHYLPVDVCAILGSILTHKLLAV